MARIQISRLFRMAERCHVVLRHRPGETFFNSNFSILFLGPCPTGCSFLLVVTSSFSLQFLFDATSLYTYVRTSFLGLRRCVCVSLILIRRARSGSCCRVFGWVCVNEPSKPGTSFWRYLFRDLRRGSACVCFRSHWAFASSSRHADGLALQLTPRSLNIAYYDVRSPPLGSASP